MRILLAHANKTEKTRYLQALGKYGIVDCFDNGRDAVVSFVNAFQTGKRYDLLVIENDLKQLDGVAAVLMIRKYELEHLASYKKLLIVFSSNDEDCRSSYEVQHAADERIFFFHGGSVPSSTLECIAEKISVKTPPAFARHRPRVNMMA